MRKFSRAHYKVIAQILKEQRPNNYSDYEQFYRYKQWERTVEQFVIWFKTDNTQFDQKLFLAACGATDAEV